MSDEKIKSIMEYCTYRCTLSNCKAETMTPHNDDPRLRWVIGVQLRDSEGCLACDAEMLGGNTDLTHTCVFREVNFCPKCARELLGTTEADYQRLERAEQVAAGKRPVSELRN